VSEQHERVAELVDHAEHLRPGSEASARALSILLVGGCFQIAFSGRAPALRSSVRSDG
jgi:hypothetical protein